MNPGEKFPKLTKLGKVTTPWGGSTEYEKFHPGVDIANAPGTPIPAPVNGVVTKVVDGEQPGAQNYGNSVTIKTANNEIHKLSHLQKPMVKPGDTVQSGNNIGTMGNTGSAYSPSGGDASHLDYRIVSAFGRYKNPKRYLNKFQ